MGKASWRGSVTKPRLEALTKSKERITPLIRDTRGWYIIYTILFDDIEKRLKTIEHSATDLRSNASVEWWKAYHICRLWFVPPCALRQTIDTGFAVSPYSWFGFTNAVRFRPLLNVYGVSVDIIPFFLGAARYGVGNPFTPTPKAKQPFAKQDTETTGRLLGLKTVQPKDFPILSLFVSLPTT